MSNHTQLVKGFMGQTTFDSALIKSNVLIMGSCELNGKHDIFMAKREKGMLYGGHEEDFQHQVGKRQRSWIYTLILPATD
jgi:hypothetical protein